MYEGNRIISIIPARGGSKSIPRKNVKLLLGKPLIAHSILESLSSRYIDQTIVSTEDSEIASISEKYSAKVLKRPEILATDTASTEPVLINVLQQLHDEGSIEPDYIVLLQPTSPIRRPNDIDKAIETLFDNSGDSLLSVCDNKSFLWSKTGKSLNYDYNTRPRRQDKQWELVENGSIYITSKKVLLEQNNQLGGSVIPYVMPSWASFEIDEPFDFDIVDFIMHKKLGNLLRNIDQIKLVIFDVDGIFTDGSVYVDEQGKEMLKFSRIDGKGIELLSNAGIKTAVITSEESSIVKLRMKKLNIKYVYTGIKNKEKIYELLKKEFSLIDEELAYCGDDVGDLYGIKKAGFTACPQNSVEVVKHECHYVSRYYGGRGFIRDVCDIILNSKESNEDE